MWSWAMFAFLQDGFRRVLVLALVVMGVQPAAAHLEFTLKQFDAATVVIVAGDFDPTDDLVQFSQLVRDGHPKAVTFNSPGGNLLKALELGRLIRQNGLDTLQLRGLECVSACAYAFVGGVARFAEPGSIGVHQASLANPDATNTGDAIDSIQRTTAIVMGYLAEMGVDPALLAVAMGYGANDIRYLSGSEMEKYRVVTGPIGGRIAQSAPTVPAAPTPPASPPPGPVMSGDAASQDWTSYGEWIQIFSRQVMADAVDLSAQYRQTIPNTFLFQYDNGWFAAVIGPFAPGRAVSERDRLVAARAIPSDSFVVAGDHFVMPVGDGPELAKAPQPDDPTALAMHLADTFQRMWSLPDATALHYLDTIYASQVMYYGKLTAKQDVITEKATFAERWPERQYVMQPGSARVSCLPSGTCSVSAVVKWRVASASRGKRSSGSASFVLTFSMDTPARLIGETSSVLDRQVASLPAQNPALPRSVGQCTRTYISRIATRLMDMPGSGSAIQYGNGGYQVSYDQIPAIDQSQLGDPINLCLVSIPQACPPGDDRGRIYRATNLRTGANWEAPDSPHSCGGA
jgi:hypothetical protein